VTARQAGGPPRTAQPRQPAELRRARLAVFAVFGLCGLITSLWSASLPATNSRLHLGETRLGIVLLATGAGAVAVMPLTGWLCDRLGSRAVLRAGAPLSALCLIGPALAPGFPALLATAFVLGGGIGSLDVAMNAQAIAVERQYQRSIMVSFHGLWSIGAVVGSATVAAGLRFGAGAPAVMVGGALAAALLVMVPGPLLLPGGSRVQAAGPGTGPGQAPADSRQGAADPRQAAAGPAPAAPAPVAPAPVAPAPAGPAPAGPAPAGPGPAAGTAARAARQHVVLLLGIVAAAGFICEGAAFSWGPLDAIRELQAAPPAAALAYTIFAAALTAGRLTGDRLLRRLGSVRAIGSAAVIAVCGYLLVFLAPSLGGGGLACDYAGWGVTGLGLATVVPAIFSAVGEREAGVGRALSWVAACAYGGELAGPSVIGPLAGATSMRTALLVPTALAALIAVLGPVAISRAGRD
jgi:MFS family permease